MSVQNTLGYQGFPIPIGTVLPYAGVKYTDAPAGYLFCDGAEYNIDDYPLLAQQIGDNLYGIASSLLKFKVPDLDNAVVVGVDFNQGTSVPSAGSVDYSLTLTEANIPSLPDSFFAVDLGAAPTYTAYAGTLGQGILGGTYNQHTGDHTGAAGIECVDTGDVQTSTAINVAYNTASKLSLSYTNAAQPLNTTLDVTGIIPKSVVLKYIIKATY
jgi:microcystin-dependent protein